MSELLDKAVEQAKRLPVDQQNAIVALILEEIADERRWQAAFARSHDTLEQLAAEAEQSRDKLDALLSSDFIGCAEGPADLASQYKRPLKSDSEP